MVGVDVILDHIGASYIIYCSAPFSFICLLEIMGKEKEIGLGFAIYLIWITMYHYCALFFSSILGALRLR